MTRAFRLRRLGWRMRLRFARSVGSSTTVDMRRMIPFYERVWREAALALDARFTEIRHGLWRVERGPAATLIDNYVVQIDDPVILNLAGDKAFCHQVLREHALSVPEHQVYTLATFDLAARFIAQRPDSYFVVKPCSGTSGARGVTTHIRNLRECRSASALASLYGDRLLIERWIPGESYRLLFLDGEMIHASRRGGLRVRGDGTSTIADLMRAAGVSGGQPAATTVSSRDIEGTLRAQRLSVGSILERGRQVMVQSAAVPITRNSEIRTVFDEDATDLIGPDLREQARRAVAALGSSFAGADVITLDPARPLDATGGAINEINTTPGLHHHYGLAGGRGGRDGAVAATCVLARLLRASARAELTTARVGARLSVQKAAPSR